MKRSLFEGFVKVEKVSVWNFYDFNHTLTTETTE